MSVGPVERKSDQTDLHVVIEVEEVNRQFSSWMVIQCMYGIKRFTRKMACQTCHLRFCFCIRSIS